ncbi:hypothetical protein Ga0100231_019810 [Opitutaceae bacterium TAV4]|nr:hypothetical protein Ga0100231_019810 [Opitutaceae bacterium TAV4]RRK01205.1 hypothetical protein Ga0100230_020570 [Opitutaceae bacterium TAV3]
MYLASTGTSFATTASWPAVLPADFSKISVSNFADDELDLVAPLAYFAPLANAIVEDGPDRGFINISVWRGPQDNKPYNARVMENVLSLAWFYTADRTWNPYRGDPAVRVRLEAALDFIGRIQAPDGAFSEYGPQRYNLAATAFMTKFLGRALENLAVPDAPPIDAGVLARAHATLRKALLATLTRERFYKVGSFFSNQYGNVWPGGLSWFRIHPEDTDLRMLWEKRLHQSAGDFQSPAGFFYEKGGPDFQYTLGTHGTNTRSAWPCIRDTPLAPVWITKETAWFEWLSWNALLQPGESWIALNRAIESRKQHPFFSYVETPMAELIPAARAFSLSREGRVAGMAATRARLARNWPGIDPLKTRSFGAFSPYTFLDRRDPAFYPTNNERDAARAQLPYLVRDRFNHARHDTRHDTGFLYLRRPAWYASFAFGDPATPQQRYGLGFVWRPDTGILLQSQSLVESLAWGTYAEKSELPFEAASFHARITIAGHPAPSPLPAAADLDQGDLTLTYPLAPDKGKPAGEKTVAFTDAGIDVKVRLPGAFTEHFPLILAKNDTATIEPDAIVIHRAGRETPLLTIAFRGASRAPAIAENDAPLPDRRLVLVRIPSDGQLGYTLRF